MAGNWDDALANYRLAVQKEPDHYLSLLAAGLLQLDQGRDEVGIALLTAAIAVNPQIVIAYVERGNALLRQQQPDLAKLDYARSLELAPDLPLQFAEQAEVFLAKRDFQRAADACAIACRLNPKCTAAMATLIDAHLWSGQLG